MNAPAPSHSSGNSRHLTEEDRPVFRRLCSVSTLPADRVAQVLRRVLDGLAPGSSRPAEDELFAMTLAALLDEERQG